jgi:NAD(P)H-hydrate epimerase
MVRIANAEEMQGLDRETISQAGISAELLMENAGLYAALWLVRAFPQKFHDTRFFCLCGPGNNGGDGFVVARHLARMGFRPRVAFVGDITKASPLCRKNHDWLLEYLPGSVRHWNEYRGEIPPDTDVIIDALLGIGIRGAVREPFASCIEAINRAGRPVVSLDTPSGLCCHALAEPGALLVQAKYTLTFGHAKYGMQVSPTREACGKVIVLDIFFPESLSERLIAPRWWVTGSSLRGTLPARPLDAHKGRMGKLLIVAGSAPYPGAAVLAARGALASGTGLIHLAVPETIISRLPNLPADVILHAVPDGGKGFFGEPSAAALKNLCQDMSALVIGPGLGREGASLECARTLAADWERPLVLDADALSLLHAADAVLPPQTVCTPHVGEFARLCQSSESLAGAAVGDHGQAAHTLADLAQGASREQAALTLAARAQAFILVKDSSNLLTAPDGKCYWMTSGHPALARGGMGDVLAGYLGGFLARGMAPLDAARLACWLHGASAHRAVRRYGSDGLSAERLAGTLAYTAALLEKGQLDIPGDPAVFEV